MSGANKGIARAEVAVRWDPSPSGSAPTDVDIVAGVYRKDDPFGAPVYVVHAGSRAPDGTITLSRESKTGQGFGFDEVMGFEFDRMSADYGRVVVGVAVQQRDGRKTLGTVVGGKVRVAEGYTQLAEETFAGVHDSTAATVAEFARDGSGAWAFAPALRGFDADPETFARVMGERPA
ncbi:TerD family protein [Streptomyces sp. SBT349]|uniref:TerD family protein n=1 Tax=Streptomyces sp. SBT349 TaxID=1580539 RepID=UPI00066D7ACF|nr:TerD family protein [Streptomyces sp. SBT349]